MYRKSHNIKLMLLLLTAFVLPLAGFSDFTVCAQSSGPVKTEEHIKQTTKTQPVVLVEPALVDNIYNNILSDKFNKAVELLDNYDGPTDRTIEQLKLITNEYKKIKEARKQTRKEEYDERLEEYLKVEAEALPNDVNDISETFAVVMQLFNISKKEQKQELLEKEYVKQLTAKALEEGKAFNEEGKWVDAYVHCYSWMESLYKDNEEYKDINKELMAKLVIEASLKDNSCDTALERFEGIRPEMVANCLAILDMHYISALDYSEMAKEGFKTCKYLGDVLAYSQEELPFSATKEQAIQWKAGLITIEGSIVDSELKIVTRDKYISVFNEMLELNNSTLRLPQEIVVSQFAEASLTALDPVTNLVWPWMVKDFQKSMTQNFTGIGIHIQKSRGVLKVASLLPDTPAYHSGLDADDEILAVNGEKTEDMPINCVVDKITGPAGTDVTLTIKHTDAPDGETEDVTITRARIIVPTVRGWQRTEEGKWLHMLDPVNKLGYVRITNFTESTASGMEEALKQMEAKGLRGLILDLRYNSGGYLNTAADVVDMFIERGLIVKSQPKWALPSYELAHKKGTHPDYPLVILVNGSSASASEIVSGALQDEHYKRATLVGTRTYGKGSVQTITDQTGYGSQLKYTMAYYYLPSGQPVKTRYVLKKENRTDWGIEPDVTFELRNDEVVEMLDVQFANDVLAKTDHNENAEPVKRYTVFETLDADPQLSVSLLVLKTKLLKTGEQIYPFVGPEAEQIGELAQSQEQPNEEK